MGTKNLKSGWDNIAVQLSIGYFEGNCNGKMDREKRMGQISWLSDLMRDGRQIYILLKDNNCFRLHYFQTGSGTQPTSRLALWTTIHFKTGSVVYYPHQYCLSVLHFTSRLTLWTTIHINTALLDYHPYQYCLSGPPFTSTLTADYHSY